MGENKSSRGFCFQGIGASWHDSDTRTNGNPEFADALPCLYNVPANFGWPEIGHLGWCIALVDVTGLPCQVPCHSRRSLIHIAHYIAPPGICPI
jgi:hypothetical protein